MLAERNAVDGITQDQYDNLGNRTQTVKGYGADLRTTSYNYDLNGRLLKTTLPLTIESYRYDALGNRIETSQWISTDGKQRLTTRQAYDAFGRVIRTGRYDYLNYNASGSINSGLRDNEISNTNLSLGLYNFFDLSAAIKSSTGNNDAVNPGLTAYVNGSGLESTTQYDLLGNKVRETNTARDTTTSVYTGKRLYQHKDLSGATTTYAYNSAGGLVTQSNDRAAKVTNALSQNLTYSYDEAGHLFSILDTSDTANPKKPLQTFLTDSLGRLSKVVSDNGSSVSYRYDANSNRRKVQARWHEGSETTIIGVNSSGMVYNQSLTLDQYKRKTYWYDYDTADRMTVSQGVLRQPWLLRQST